MKHLKPPKRLGQRAVGLLLSAAILTGALSPAAMAAESGPPEQQPESYAFQTSQEVFPEDCGKAFITVTRTGDLSKEAEVTLGAYDMSAAYGQDYRLLADGSPVERLDGSRSVFDAFKEDGVLGDREETDTAILAGLVEMQETGLSPEELMAEYGLETGAEDQDEPDEGSSLEVLEQIGARAASLTLRFAPWQDCATVELEILEDDAPEYSEAFLLGLPGGGVFSGSIRDNEEPAPQAQVSFDQPEAAEDVSGTAPVGLTRTGDLATMSSVLLSRAGAPYGYITFNPYQSEQLVELPRGDYTLSEASGCVLGEGTSVSVEANPVATASITVGATQALLDQLQAQPKVIPADPELDTVPVYDAVPAELSGADEPMLLSEEDGPSLDDPMMVGASNTITGKSPDWVKDWAKKGSYENESCIVVAPTMTETDGKVSGALFQRSDRDSSGKYSKFTQVTKDNAFCLDTHGGESAMRSAHVAAQTVDTYDSEGMESFTLNYHIHGLNRNMHISAWANETLSGSGNIANSGELNVKGDKNSEEFTTAYNSMNNGKSSNAVSNAYHFVQNRDPSNSDDGCETYIANAIRFNKRKYLINLVGSNELDFTDGKDSAIINEADRVQIKTMWRDVKQDTAGSSKIPLRITYDGDHVMQIVGYQVENPRSNFNSSVHKLYGDTFIRFDSNFLDGFGTADHQYAYTTQYQGQNYSAFNVRIIVEKVGVEHSIESSALGDLELTNAQDGKLYKGDDAVFRAGANTAEGVSLSGVFVRAKTSSNNEWKTWTMHADSDHLVRVHLDRHYDQYVFQPVYSSSADVLTVTYAAGAQDRGQLVIKEGQVVSKDEYVKNEYVALSAKPNDGYVTQWTSNGRIFYGDVFHYQLDGNPDNNSITVDFVKPSLSTEDISGSLSVTDSNLYLSSLSGSKPLADTEFTVIGDREYTGRTSSSGKFTIKGFRGVKGGTYSMLVMTGSIPSYMHFTFGDKNTYNQRLPQFGPGVFYPESVRVRLDNSGEDSNYVELRPDSSVEVTVEVFNQEQSPYDIQKVELRMMAENGYLVDTQEAALDSSLTHASGGGNYSYYTAKIQAQNLAANTSLYVNVAAGMRTTSGDIAQVETGPVNSGYTFITPITDTSLPIQDNVPIIPAAGSAADVDLADLDIPFIGMLDFSIGANNGAFFIRAADPNDPSIYSLTAGYSITPTFGVTNPSDRYAQTKGNADKLRAMRDGGFYKPLGSTEDVGTNVAADKNAATATQAGQDKSANAKSYFTGRKIYIQPAVFLKFSMKTYVNEKGDTVTDLIGYDAVIGFDARVVLNLTANIYGVPCYVALTLAMEAYAETQGKLATGEGAIHSDGDKTEIIYNPNRGDVTNWDVCLQLPILSATVKGGVGFNNFSSFYLQGKVNFKLGVAIGPGVYGNDPKKVGINAGGSLSFGFGGGMDILVFSPNLMLNSPPLDFGNKKIRDSIFPVSSNKPGTLSAQEGEAQTFASMEEAMASLPTEEDLLTALNDAPITLADRGSAGSLLRSGPVSGQVLMDSAFKGTQVKLTRLSDGGILAVMLADNGAKEGSYNFLSAAYAVSHDEGKTWNSVEKISDSSSLQFDVSVFELEDSLLVTWSQGDIDSVLEKKELKNLTAADLAAALNAMDLKGRLFSKADGKPLGEAFTIGENPGVACAMLEAVESGGKLYCYYARSQFPTGENVTYETIAQRERTIACAVKDGDAITTHQVLAQSQDGSQTYRVMEVVPFNHQGIRGEALVIDRDGKIAEKTDGGQIIPSNTDRQIFVRFYAASGEPATTALIPVTDPDVCAQHVQIVSNGEQLYMLWNQDGEIAYLNQFAVPASEKDTPQASGALAIVDPATGEVTVPQHEDEVSCGSAAQHSTLHLDRAFDASISSAGDVLVSWVADEDSGDDEDDGFMAEEVFGVVLKTVEENGLYHLEAVGSPVALTDEESALGNMDGLCLGDDSFLLAYAKLDADTRYESKTAQVKAVHSVYEPDLRVKSVSADQYPLPGTDAAVNVTVTNQGLQPLEDVEIRASGAGLSGTTTLGSPLLPGATKTLQVNVPIPEGFNATTKLDVTASGTGDQAAYTDGGQTEILYGSYFVPDAMAKLDSIPDTSSYVARLTVHNNGNAPGSPEIKYSSYIPGMAENSGKLEQTFKPELVVEPHGSATITSKLNETPVTNDQTIRVQVSLGEGHDQAAESYAPPQKASDPQSEEAHHPFVDVPDDAWYAGAVQRVFTLGLMTGVNATHFAPAMKTTRATLAQVLYRMEGSPKVEKKVSYKDVKDTDWFADAVQWASQQGIATGYGGGRFGPNDPATREQTAAAIYRYAKWKGLTGNQSETSIEDFSDYRSISSWATEAMAWAVESGVIHGKSGLLDPKGTSNRAELAQQLSNMF